MFGTSARLMLSGAPSGSSRSSCQVSDRRVSNGPSRQACWPPMAIRSVRRPWMSVAWSMAPTLLRRCDSVGGKKTSA